MFFLAANDRCPESTPSNHPYQQITHVHVTTVCDVQPSPDLESRGSAQIFSVMRGNLFFSLDSIITGCMDFKQFTVFTKTRRPLATGPAAALWLTGVIQSPAPAYKHYKHCKHYKHSSSGNPAPVSGSHCRVYVTAHCTGLHTPHCPAPEAWLPRSRCCLVLTIRHTSHTPPPSHAVMNTLLCSYLQPPHSPPTTATATSATATASAAAAVCVMFRFLLGAGQSWGSEAGLCLIALAASSRDCLDTNIWTRISIYS